MKFVSRLLVAGLLSTVAFAPAQAEVVKITLLGVGDVYNFNGGKTRGGLARLNAVARAERAANPNFLYLFDGDLLSPSLLSGLDRGMNMIELTNVVPFDLAVPGNHEYDFGVENFDEKLKASKYPWAAINITHADGSAVKGLGGVMMKEVAGVKIALIPVAQDTSPQVASTGELKFGPTAETAIDAAKQARKDGAELVVGVVQAPHSDDQKMFASKAFDVILSGDDHDLVVQYNGITAYVDTSTEANHLVPIDLTVNIEEKDGKRTVKWEPNFRFIDTASVTPDPETQKLVDAFAAELDKELNVVIGKTDGAAGQPAQHRAHPGGGHRQPDCRRDEGRGCGRHRHHQWRRHSRRQGICGGQRHHPARHPERIALRQCDGSDRGDRQADLGGAGKRLQQI